MTHKIDILLMERKEARSNKDWQLSDSLRMELKSFGVNVIDTASGQSPTSYVEWLENQHKAELCLKSGEIAYLRSQIAWLEHAYKVLREREHEASRRIGDLVSENCYLKYGQHREVAQ